MNVCVQNPIAVTDTCLCIVDNNKLVRVFFCLFCCYGTHAHFTFEQIICVIISINVLRDVLFSFQQTNFDNIPFSLEQATNIYLFFYLWNKGRLCLLTATHGHAQLNWTWEQNCCLISDAWWRLTMLFIERTIKTVHFQYWSIYCHPQSDGAFLFERGSWEIERVKDIESSVTSLNMHSNLFVLINKWECRMQARTNTNDS